MKIRDLKQGDRITQRIDNAPVAFEVLSIQQIGRRFKVTFQSVFGTETACYQGNACLTTA